MVNVNLYLDLEIQKDQLVIKVIQNPFIMIGILIEVLQAKIRKDLNLTNMTKEK